MEVNDVNAFSSISLLWVEVFDGHPGSDHGTGHPRLQRSGKAEGSTGSTGSTGSIGSIGSTGSQCSGKCVGVVTSWCYRCSIMQIISNHHTCV